MIKYVVYVILLNVIFIVFPHYCCNVCEGLVSSALIYRYIPWNSLYFNKSRTTNTVEKKFYTQLVSLHDAQT